MDPGRYVALKTKGLITLEKGPLPGQIAFTATQFDITGKAIDPDRGIFEKESLLALRKELSDKIAAIDQMIIDTDKTLSP